MSMVALAEVCSMLPTLTDDMLGGRSVVNVCSFVPLAGKAASSDACSMYSAPGVKLSRSFVAGLALLVAVSVWAFGQSCASAFSW